MLERRRPRTIAHQGSETNPSQVAIRETTKAVAGRYRGSHVNGRLAEQRMLFLSPKQQRWARKAQTARLRNVSLFGFLFHGPTLWPWKGFDTVQKLASQTLDPN